MKERSEWSCEDIVRTASLSVAQGSSWITLRTTEFYSTKRLGIEHGNEEIAERILVAHKFHAALGGVMGRVNVPGTPFEGCKSVDEERISQIIAICCICGGPGMRNICVVPPTRRSLQSGANVITIEIGAIPRSDTIECAPAWNDFGLAQAGDLLRRAGYRTRIAEETNP